MKTEAELLEWLRREEQVPITGWDFSYIADRCKEEPPPWSYTAIVQEALSRAESLLDLGTGGGERLASLVPLPAQAHATEGYAPNIPVARARLEPLGVSVHALENWRQLPFPEETFDLVLSRHMAFMPAEVYRVLRPGGSFITQQVGAANNLDLNHILGAPDPDRTMMPESTTLAEYRNQLDATGFEVTVAEEAFPPSHFSDVGAIVFYLKAIPWQIPDFSVDGYFDRLKDVQLRMERTGPLPISEPSLRACRLQACSNALALGRHRDGILRRSI